MHGGYTKIKTMNIYLYNNTKRLNSTALPPAVSQTLDCVLKDNCSILSPIIRVKLSSKPTENYMSFDDRYYWITDIVSVANDLWEIHGQIDALATFRGHIFNTNAFVLYDSTPNDQLPDSRLGIETDCDTYTATANMPWYYTTGTQGTYFIATTGEKDYFDLDLPSGAPGAVVQNARNGTGVYAIPYSSIEQIGFDLSDLWSALSNVKADFEQDQRTWLAYLQNLTITTPADIVIALVQTAYAFGNILVDTTIEYPTRLALLLAQNLLGGGSALQNVKASYWLPFTVPDAALSGLLHTPDKLALGTYTDTVSGLKRVSDPIITAVNISVPIPWHFNDWRDVSCTEIMLYIPLIGCINIPPEVVKGNDELTLKFSLNLYSGELACEILCNGGELGTYGVNCAMNILIGDSNINMGGAVNTIVSAVTKNYAAAGASAAETLAGMSTSVGGIGGGAGTGLTNQIVCICRCHETSQTPSALLGTIGTPTRQLKTLSTGLGYVQCLNAQCSGAAVTGEPYPTQSELTEINNYLNTGVYLE